MTTRLNRRQILAGAMVAPWLRSQTSGAEPSPRPELQPKPTLDLHIHLFGIGGGQSGCRLAKTITEGVVFKALVAKLESLLAKLPSRGPRESLDAAYVLLLADQLRQSGLAKGVILAQDAVYHRNGKADWDRTSFYIPNDYLFKVVGRYPERMIPCVSINPDRADAMEELERCVERGARILKIHPPTQAVDVADRKHAPFFRRCAERKVIVMVHTGHEHSAPVADVALADPARLQLPLDQGCTVVACHCGTGWPTDKPDMLPTFLKMLDKHANLWGDTSVLGTAGRVPDVARLLEHKAALARLLHGSDFPFPCQPWAFAPIVGLKGWKELQRVQHLANLLGQDLALKDLLGIGRSCAERAYRLVCGGA